jgi:hypothetical protein
VWNYVAGSIGFNGNTVGSLSDKYDTLFTPAGYAFSIWGIIFLLLIFHAWHQIKCVFIRKKYDDFVLKMGPWLAIANISNGLWLYAWLMEYTGLSIVFMLVILGSLVMCVIRLNMQRWDAPFVVIRNVWWPIVVYLGWISVATIANVSAYLVKIGWQEGRDEVFWTVAMIGVAVALNLFMLFARSMREFASVGTWALIAIAFRQWDAFPVIQWTALFGSVVLIVAMSYHAYLNWTTNPLYKWIHRKA